MILFLVTMGNAHVIVWAGSREHAKRQAQQWLGIGMDHYMVTPLTNDGDRVHLAITLNV